MSDTKLGIDLETELHILKFQRNRILELNNYLEEEISIKESTIEVLREVNLKLKKLISIAVNKDIEYRYFLSNSFLYIGAFKNNKLIAVKGWSIKSIKKRTLAKEFKTK